ncbi:MAG: hypothetical protein RIC55_34090 [Pirellulaceae bacterium]
MKKEWVVRNLNEAAEHLQAAIKELEADNEAGFEAWLPFVYRKLNTAWNWRDRDPSVPYNGEQYEASCLFPLELEKWISDADRD